MDGGFFTGILPLSGSRIRDCKATGGTALFVKPVILYAFIKAVAACKVIAIKPFL